MAEELGLAEAVEALRAELTEAVALGRGAPMRFKLEPLEPLELTVQAVVTKSGDGRIGWKVLGIGGSYESAQTQTVTLRLNPQWIDEDGRPTTEFLVADQGSPHDVIGPHE